MKCRANDRNKMVCSVKYLCTLGILCFGPTALAARLESSKAFAKSFMNKNGIPTARWKSFTNFDKACDFIMK